MYYVYFLKSLRHYKYYTGSTEKEPRIRLKEHNSGTNEWTRLNGPFSLIYYEVYFCKQDAEQREKFYKTGFGRKIRNAILSSISATGGPARHPASGG